MISLLLRAASAIRDRLAVARREARWTKLRSLGMIIGDDVWLPDSTTIDTSHCFLISIGDHCGFGEECVLLAHDAQMDEYLDAARLGRVVIHESCHLGARTIVLPGVTIGPRTIVGMVNLMGNVVFTTPQLLMGAATTPGKPYSEIDVASNR